MNNRKILIWALIILILILIIWGGNKAYKAIKKIPDNFKFDLGLKRIDVKQLFSGSGQTNVDLGISISNKNGFSVPVSDLSVQIMYNGEVVAYSTQPSDSFIIPNKNTDVGYGNGNYNFSHNITVLLGSNAIDIVKNIILGKPVQFTYTIQAKLFKFYPLSITDTYNY